MYRSSQLFIRITFVVLIIFLTGSAGSKKRKFEILFHLNDIQSFVPSNQMAVWLESTDSTFIKTLFLSEYLSYGGYNIPEICNDWSSKARWEEATKEEFDAVTAATPAIGDVNLKIECPATMVPEGKYFIYIEVHLVNEYNELYTGELTISGKKSVASLQVKHIPVKYPKKTEGDLLSNVLVTAK